MSFTATPTPTGGVQLHLTAPVNHKLRSLTRTDANGLRRVRLQDGQSLSGGSLVVTDHECALTGRVLYRASTVPTSAPGSRSWQSATTTLAGLLDRDRIAAAVRPATGVSPWLVLDAPATRPHATVVHEPIGRPDPLLAIGVQHTRRGVLSVLCQDYAEALALANVAGAGEVILWRQRTHPGLDLYFTALSTDVAWVDESDPARWQVQLAYVEVAPPSGPILGAYGWSVADLAAAGMSVEEVPDAYPTVADLTIGPVG